MADETVGAAGAVTEEQIPAEEQVEETSPQATETEGETEEEHKPKKLGGWQRKQIRAEAERDQWRDIALGLMNKQPAAEEKKPEPPAEDKRPRKEDFIVDKDAGTYDADKYEDALLDWNRRQAKKELLEEIEKRDKAKSQQTEQERMEQSWREKESAFEADHEDYKEFAVEATKFLQANQKSPTAQALGAAITESEMGPALLRELGEDYETLERIAKLSPLAAVRELGKIEGRLAEEKSAEKQEADTEELTPAQPPVIKAPPKPPSPVKKVSPAAKTADEILRDPNTDWNTWLKTRNKQLEQRRG